MQDLSWGIFLLREELADKGDSVQSYIVGMCVSAQKEVVTLPSLPDATLAQDAEHYHSGLGRHL